MNASVTQVACMVHANSLGNATAKKDGVDCFVTKTLTTALTTSLARTEPPAPILAREVTLALAVRAILDPTVRLRSMNVTPTLARMEEVVRTWKIAIPAHAHLDSMAKTVSSVL